MQLDVDIEPTFRFSYMKCIDKQKDITIFHPNCKVLAPLPYELKAKTYLHRQTDEKWRRWAQQWRILSHATWWSMRCQARTKFYSSDFCFSPKLSLGLDNVRKMLGFSDFGSFTTVSPNPPPQMTYQHRGSTLVESRRLTCKVMF